MPSKPRWGLNPKKWFDTMSNTTYKRDNPTAQIGATVTRTMSLTTNIPRLSRTKSKSKVTPMTISNDVNKNNASSSTPMTQLQLPAFGARRERISTSFNRQNAFFPVHTEPTIRRNGRLEDKLAINTKRPSITRIPTTIFESSKKENSQPTTSMQQMEMSLFNMSRRCLVNYPRRSPIPIPAQESSLPARFSAESSLIDDNDNSSSSEIFNDEHHQFTGSKNALLTSDVLSVNSLTDSQTSLDRFQSRPTIHHYQEPVYVSEILNDQPQQQTSTTPLPRSESVEDVLEDKKIIPTTTKRPQSSAAIMKKIEKRIRTSQSPIVTLEKPEFVRVANATYRLNVDKIKHGSNSRKNAVDSFIGCTNSDDSLRPANDEECYATLPRGSSTEQINKIIQNDLRTIVNGCIRPIVTSLGNNHLPKTHHQHRYKRSHIHNDHKQLIIEDITDKLLSSIDYPIYAQHQRCY